MKSSLVWTAPLLLLCVPAIASADPPKPAPANVERPPAAAPARPLDGMFLPQGKAPAKPLDGMFLPQGKAPARPLDGLFLPGKGPRRPLDGLFLPRGRGHTGRPLDGLAVAPGTAGAGVSQGAVAPRSIRIDSKTGKAVPITAPGKFQPRAAGEATPPAVKKVVDDIYAANDFNETHRINGPQVVFGAVKAPDGTLTKVQLQPGTKGYTAAVGVTDYRLNGAPPIFNPDGEIVYQPHNTPL